MDEVFASLRKDLELEEDFQMGKDIFRVYAYLHMEKKKAFLCEHDFSIANPHFGEYCCFESLTNLRNREQTFEKYPNSIWLYDNEITLVDFNKQNKLYSYTLNKEGFLF